MQKLASLVLAGLALSLSPLAAQPIPITAIPIAGRIAAPPAGARIELYPDRLTYEEELRRLTSGAELPPLASAAPRPDGSYEIAAPGPGFYRIVLRADGFVPLENRLVPLVAPEELPPATLRPASPFEVLVLGPSGVPERGIAVRAQAAPADRSGAGESWGPAEVQGVSGEDGRVKLPRRRGDRVSFFVVTSRFLDWQENVEGASATLRLRQRPVGVLEVHGPDGKPAAGVLARLDPALPLGPTGTDGRLALPVLDQGGTELWLEGPGGLSTTIAWPAPGTGPVAVTLAAPRLASGRVVDALTGDPLPGALVWIEYHNHPVGPPTYAGAGGELELRLPSDQGSSVTAVTPGYLQSWVPAATATASLLLRLTPAARLAGRVVDTAGQPIAGAKIEAERRDQRPMAMDGFSGQAVSATDGSFLLESLAAGATYTLRASHPGFAPGTTTGTTAASGQPAPAVRLILPAGWSAGGRVMDEQGRPVAGATLTLMRLDGERGGPSREQGLPNVQSDATGAFRFDHLLPGSYDLIARASGFGDVLVPGLEPPADGSALEVGTVTLPAGVVIEGRVTDKRGRPVPGTEVDSRVSSPSRPWLAGLGPPVRATTGADGRFKFGDLRRGERYDLWIRHPDYAPARLPGVEAPTPDPVSVELRPARVLSGRVVGPAGEPVANAKLERIEENGAGRGGETYYGRSSESLTDTDSQGRFRAGGLEPGIFNLEVSAEGYKKRVLRGLELPEEADVEDLEIILERGLAVTGRVLDDRGRPVSGARVSAMMENDGGEMNMDIGFPSTETDGEGRYRLGGLELGRYRISAFSPEGVRAEAITIVRPGDNLVNLSFGRTTEVSGRVVDESGEPVAGARVSLAGQPDGRSAPSGADGAFRFAAIPDGTYRLSAGSEGLIGPAEPLEVEVRGRPVGDLEIRLRRGGTLLTGRLLGLAPGEIEKVAVLAHPPNHPWEPRRATVNRDGSYRLSGLLPGTWQVVASLDSGRKAQGSIRLEPDQEQAVLDLELTRGLVLSGRVLADGAPLVAAQVLLGSLARAGGTPEAVTDHEGRFRLEGVEPGTYIVQAIHSPTGLGAARSVELTGDADIAIEIATGAVRGQVVLPPGEPATGLAIALEGEDTSLGASFLGPAVQIDDQGRFEIPRVAAGSYRLTLRKDGTSIDTRPVRVEPGGTAVVRFDLKL